MRVAAVDGPSLNVAADVGAGRVIVLLHGVGLNSQVWAPQIEALRPGYRVIAIDLPGHGGSPIPPVGVTLDDLVGAVADRLRSLDPGRAVLIGHSLGALVAAGLAAGYPGLVESLVMLSPVYGRGPEARAAVLARAAQLMQGCSAPDAPLARWFDAQTDPVMVAQVRALLLAADPAGYARAYAAFAAVDDRFERRYTQIRCPTLLVTGGEDANSSPEMLHALGRVIPDATTRLISGHRHMIGLTAADEVNRVLIDWLAAILPVPVERDMSGKTR